MKTTATGKTWWQNHKHNHVINMQNCLVKKKSRFFLWCDIVTTSYLGNLSRKGVAWPFGRRGNEFHCTLFLSDTPRPIWNFNFAIKYKYILLSQNFWVGALGTGVRIFFFFFFFFGGGGGGVMEGKKRERKGKESSNITRSGIKNWAADGMRERI